jgi:EpsI family protein
MTTLFRPISLKPAVVLGAMAIMLGAVALAETLRPHKYWADFTVEPRYDQVVPHAFGDWTESPYGARVIVDPVQEENLKRIYSQTFARTFIHKPTGRVMMLSIAYGRDQSNDTQLHTPDQCYPSQGFRVDENKNHDIPTDFGAIKSVQLRTSLGTQRKEPLTYFIRVGDGIARNSKERNLERIKLAIKGYRVDGMLFRVSEATDQDDAFGLQDQFVNDLLKALAPKQRSYIIGTRGA